MLTEAGVRKLLQRCIHHGSDEKTKNRDSNSTQQELPLIQSRNDEVKQLVGLETKGSTSCFEESDNDRFYNVIMIFG